MTIEQLEEGNKLRKEIEELESLVRNLNRPEVSMDITYPNGWSLNSPEFMKEKHKNQMAFWHREYIKAVEEELLARRRQLELL